MPSVAIASEGEGGDRGIRTDVITNCK